MSDRQSELREAWTRFVESGEMTRGVRPPVAASWHRCRGAALSPGSVTMPTLTTAQLRSHRRIAGALLDTVGSAAQHLHNELTEGMMSVAAVDARGCVLCLWGDPPDAGVDGGIAPGSVFGEALAGTTSISMALDAGEGAWCDGVEHYCEPLQGIVDAALPIRDRHAHLAGLLVLFADTGRIAGPLMFSMARTAKQLASQTRQAHNVRSRATAYAELFQRLSATSGEPMLLVGARGYIRQINPQAMRLLGLDIARDLDRPVDQIARFSPPLAESVVPGEDVAPTEVEIHARGATFTAILEGRALFTLSGEFLGTVIFFSHKRTMETAQSPDERRTARFRFQDIIGESPALLAAKRSARKAAAASVNVLLEGESGTGKELFAQAIHNDSERAYGPFVSVNCAAIPAELIESELFGYQEGAFTGARRGGMVGKFESANGGTIFLDEIGDMPLDVQARCLRVIESRTVTPVGQHEEIPLDIRIIAATNKHLLHEVERGGFREDLYYRLSVFRIHLPRLSQCTADIPVLAEHFVQQFCNELNREPISIDDNVLACFDRHDWSGNMRELKNAIEHAVTVDTDAQLTIDDLPEVLQDRLGAGGEDGGSLQREVADAEREICRRALIAEGGNVSQAARALGIGRATMYRKMNRFGIDRDAILREVREAKAEEQAPPLPDRAAPRGRRRDR